MAGTGTDCLFKFELPGEAPFYYNNIDLFFQRGERTLSLCFSTGIVLFGTGWQKRK